LNLLVLDRFDEGTKAEIQLRRRGDKSLHALDEVCRLGKLVVGFEGGGETVKGGEEEPVVVAGGGIGAVATERRLSTCPRSVRVGAGEKRGAGSGGSVVVSAVGERDTARTGRGGRGGFEGGEGLVLSRGSVGGTWGGGVDGRSDDPLTGEEGVDGSNGAVAVSLGLGNAVTNRSSVATASGLTRTGSTADVLDCRRARLVKGKLRRGEEQNVHSAIHASDPTSTERRRSLRA
jgi:hypothetical protein